MWFLSDKLGQIDPDRGDSYLLLRIAVTVQILVAGFAKFYKKAVILNLIQNSVSCLLGYK
jgi:hypothetical protein